jgi:hypothetical protein
LKPSFSGAYYFQVAFLVMSFPVTSDLPSACA